MAAVRAGRAAGARLAETNAGGTFTLNPTTTIQCSLNTASPVKLTLFDIFCQAVATLVNEYKSVGSHKVQWRANTMPSGVYYYRLEADGFSKTHKMVLMK